MKDKLKSKPCTNQGFVLDGFPKTYEQAKELFSGTRRNCFLSFHCNKSFLFGFDICLLWRTAEDDEATDERSNVTVVPGVSIYVTVKAEIYSVLVMLTLLTRARA